MTGVGNEQPSLAQVLQAGKRTLSFEFFPPRTPGDTVALWQAIHRLEQLAPDAVSVTFGAGGSRARNTVQITEQIVARTTLRPIAHLTCVGMDRPSIEAILAQYAAAGVEHVLALRGDPPRPESALGEQPIPSLVPSPRQPPPVGQLTTAAELTRLVKASGSFCVGVAAFPDGHPESRDAAQDLDALRAKVDAGAQFAITQFFFHTSSFLALRERIEAAGLNLPLIAGIMPVTSLGQIQRFAQLSGTALPAQLVARLQQQASSPASVRQIGVEYATELCQHLITEEVAGLHFYTLNTSSATVEIAQALNLPQRFAHSAPLGATVSGTGAN